MTSGTTGQHLILYDGLCGFCNRVVRSIIKHDPQRLFNFASLQSETGKRLLKKYGEEADQLSTYFLISDYGTAKEQIYSRMSATLFIADRIGGPWKLAKAMRLIPPSLRDLLYRFTAKVRYPLFVRYDTCPIPTEQERSRFLDI